MNVKDIMTKNPAFTSPSSSIIEAVEILRELDVRHLPVVDNSTLVGIVSERDIQAHILPLTSELTHPEEAATRKEDPISKVMSGGVVSVNPETSLGETIDLIVENKISAVPVVNPLEGTLVGIVSYVDLLNAMREMLDD